MYFTIRVADEYPKKNSSIPINGELDPKKRSLPLVIFAKSHLVIKRPDDGESNCPNDGRAHFNYSSTTLHCSQ